MQPRLASAIAVVNDGVVASEGSESARLKRPADSLLEEKPEMKRRNRRLFGALMGTLKKFKQEEDQAQASEAAQRRAVAMQGTERKAQEEAQAARDAVQRRRQEAREADEVKRLERLYARKISRREREASFLRTATSPSVLWLPRKTCKEVEPALIAQQAVFEAWKAEQLEALKREKAKLSGGPSEQRQQEERLVQQDGSGGGAAASASASAAAAAEDGEEGEVEAEGEVQGDEEAVVEAAED